MVPQAVPEFQGLLAELARKLGVGVEKLLSRLDRLSPAEQYAFVTEAYPELAASFLAASGDLTAQWYAEQPTAPTAPGVALFDPESAPLPPVEQLAANARWALTQNLVIPALQGAATRALFNASRDTVLLNVEREGVRWARHASANACGFCRMLATRGAVYTSSAAATRVVGRSVDISVGDRRAIAAGTLTRDQARANRSVYASARAAARAGKHVGDTKDRRLRGNAAKGDRYHDHCHCIAIPVRAGDTYEPAPYVEQWEDDYRAARDAGLTSAPDIARFMEKGRAAAAKMKAKVVAAVKSDPIQKLPRINDGIDVSTTAGKLKRADANIVNTNPKYGTAPEYDVNCQRVVQALELRARGYDVTALPNEKPSPLSYPSTWSAVIYDPPRMAYPPNLKAAYPDYMGWNDALRARIKHYSFGELWREKGGSVRNFTPSTPGQIMGELGKQDVGARGWITCDWTPQAGGGAHIFSWEVYEDPATAAKRVRLIDGQTGSLDASGNLPLIQAGSLHWMRVDDLQPTAEVVGMVLGAPP
ncbi:MAG: hypothetical protein QM662_02500 [Gordonia sp. (in: high G+C Gram-positive bacteria)]